MEKMNEETKTVLMLCRHCMETIWRLGFGKYKEIATEKCGWCENCSVNTAHATIVEVPEDYIAHAPTQ